MRLRLALVIVGLLAAVSCGNMQGENGALASEEAHSGLRSAEKRNPAPDFELKDADGKPVKLSDYAGKVVLLNFWATWCGPCKIEIPWFIDFEQRYRDQGFAVLGVSMDEDGWESVKPYVKQHDVNYRMTVGDDMTAQKYGGVESLPTSFVIDREGRIVATHVGLVSKRVYEDAIVELLKEARQQSASVAPASAARGAE